MQRFMSVAVLLLAGAAARAQDMPLSLIVLPGEGWREEKKVDGPAALAGGPDGTLHVADRQGKVHRLDGDGKWSEFATASGPVGCLAVGRDGKLLAAIPARNRVVRFEDGKEADVVTGVAAVDVVQAGNGQLYYTVPDKKAVYLAGKANPVAEDLFHPSGLAVWNGGGTLVVGEASGKHLCAFRIQKDGSLDARERYYTLRVRPNQPSGVKALALDTASRLYAATREGVQVFDPTGRMCGVLNSPRREPVTALAFAGAERDRLYVICGGRLFSRKLKAKGS